MNDDEADTWGISRTVEYILHRKFKKVAAQFPDQLLTDATHVVQCLSDACKLRGHQVQVRSSVAAYYCYVTAMGKKRPK